jgi:hydroxymethylbilane synthase
MVGSIPEKSIRIGTRGSPLALAQTRLTIAALKQRAPSLAEPEVIVITTSGDRITDRPLADVGGKGLFAKEIEAALLQDRVDIAVHSLKDMETDLPDGLVIHTVLPREDPRDMLVSPHAASLNDLPKGATVGTSSVRRAALALARRPDLAIMPIRGNVETRLKKVERGEVDATFLAVAGMKRLGIQSPMAHPIATTDMLPAACQGIVAIECRSGDTAKDAAIRTLLEQINHPTTYAAALAERAALAAMDGSCRTPIGAHAQVEDGMLTLDVLIAAHDGSSVFETQRTGPVGEATTMGTDAGEELRARAPAALFVDVG